MHITKTFFLYSISDIDKELPYRLTETQKKATVSRYYITFEGKRYVCCYRSVMKRREGCGRHASAAPTDGSGASQAKLDGHRPGTHTPTATLPTSNPLYIPLSASHTKPTERRPPRKPQGESLSSSFLFFIRRPSHQTIYSAFFFHHSHQLVLLHRSHPTATPTVPQNAIVTSICCTK